MTMSDPALDDKIRMELLEEWHDQAGGIFSPVLERDQSHGNNDTRGNLISELGPSGEAKVAAMNHLQIVVGEADGGEGDCRKDDDPNEGIRQIRPKQSGHQDCNRDQQSTHGGSAGLFLMRLRAFFANVLADLKLAQTLNHDRTDNQSCKKCGEAGERRAEGQITEDAEGRKVMKELQI